MTKAPRASMRGMSMRDMKGRSQGKLPRSVGRPRDTDAVEKVAEGSEEQPIIEDGELRDQGDGVYVPRRGKSHDEDESRECPDEAPPGWAEP